MGVQLERYGRLRGRQSPGDRSVHPRHRRDLGEVNEGGLVGAALVVSGEPAAAADPRQESCEDPALREYDEAI